jgi:transposase
MYTRKSRLLSRKQSRLLEHFVAGTTARAAAEIIGVQPNTSIRFYMRLRVLIASQLPSYELNGEVEADESYFGGIRKGKRGRGASGKVAVFGLLKRGGKVFTAIVPNARTETLLPIIEERVTPDSIVYTDTFKAYNALDVTELHHMRFNGGNHQNLYKQLKYWHSKSKH